MMYCPHCGEETKVIETRMPEKGRRVYRRRECVAKHRFTTVEYFLPGSLTGGPMQTGLNATRRVPQNLGEVVKMWALKHGQD